MSKKISSFFKVIPKFNKSFYTNQEEPESTTQIKNELESNFEINFNQKNPKNEENSPNLSKIHDCQVILQNVNKIIEEKELNSLKINKCELKSPKIKNIGNSSKKSSKNGKAIQNGRKLSNKNSLNNLSKIKLKELKDFPIGCQYCDKRFAKFCNMKQHMGKYHPKELKQKIFECDFDGKIFDSRAKLLNHIVSHKMKINCEMCQGKILPRIMVSHIKNYHSTEPKNQCKICQKYFKTKKILQNHIKTHDKKFQCQICFRMFPYESRLKTHFKFFHENPKSFECEICGLKVDEKSNLTLHQRTHDKYRPKPFKCQRCDYSTDIRNHFNEHQKVHEYQDKRIAAMKNPIKCEKCSTFCRNKEMLYQHMKLSHPKDPFQCDLCGKYFKTKLTLGRHIIEKVCQKFKILS